MLNKLLNVEVSDASASLSTSCTGDDNSNIDDTISSAIHVKKFAATISNAIPGVS